MHKANGEILFALGLSFQSSVLIPKAVLGVRLLQTAHSWANAGVLLGERIRRG